MSSSNYDRAFNKGFTVSGPRYRQPDPQREQDRADYLTNLATIREQLKELSAELRKAEKLFQRYEMYDGKKSVQRVKNGVYQVIGTRLNAF